MIQTLAWQSEQKAREADALREQLVLAEKRQQIEMDGVKTNLQVRYLILLRGGKNILGLIRAPW